MTGLYSVSMLSLDWEGCMSKNSKTDDEKGQGSASTDLPGRRLVPSKSSPDARAIRDRVIAARLEGGSGPSSGDSEAVECAIHGAQDDHH